MANSIPASPNDYCKGPWPDHLPDVPFFLSRVAGLWEADDTLPGGQLGESAMALAVQAASDALLQGSDAPLEAWCQQYDPEWGQS